jgi:hypothetical protein
MRRLTTDARGFAFSGSQASWRLGFQCWGHLEDVQGALEADQVSTAVLAARGLVEHAAVVITLGVDEVHRLPPRWVRAAAALDRIDDESLRQDVALMLFGQIDADATSLRSTCERVFAAAVDAVPGTPNLLSPEGFFPAVKLAGEWLRVLEAVGLPHFFPDHWVQADDEDGS